LAASEAYAARKGLELDNSLKDEGVSAYSGAHRKPGTKLSYFLERIEQGDVVPGSYLLVDSFDRLTRQEIMEAIGLLTRITTAGVTVVTLNDEREYHAKSDLMDVMLAVMHMSRAYEESAEKGRKVREARGRERQLAREERRPFTSNGPHWLSLTPDVNGDPIWTPLPERVAIVRRIFDLKEDGLGYAKIARLMNEEHAPTPRGRGGWSESTVSELINSRAVFGAYQPWRKDDTKGRVRDGDEIPDFYPAIISEEQFYSIQASISNRRNPDARPGQKEFRNILIGIVSCEVCRGTVGYLRSTFPRKPNWRSGGVLRCNAVNAGRCDNRLRLPYDKLEAELWPLISRLPGYSKSSLADSAKLDAAREKKSALEARVEQLIDGLEQGHDVGSRLRQRQAELQLLTMEISHLQERERMAGGSLGVSEIRRRMQVLQADYEGAGDEQRYRIRAKLNSILAASVRPMMMTRTRLRVEIQADIAVQVVSVRGAVGSKEPWPFRPSSLIEWHLVTHAPEKSAGRERPEDEYSPTDA
jgi:DNA invertase Pin-like site-specific DNA recombinase